MGNGDPPPYRRAHELFAAQDFGDEFLATLYLRRAGEILGEGNEGIAFLRVIEKEYPIGRKDILDLDDAEHAGRTIGAEPLVDPALDLAFLESPDGPYLSRGNFALLGPVVDRSLRYAKVPCDFFNRKDIVIHAKDPSQYTKFRTIL